MKRIAAVVALFLAVAGVVGYVVRNGPPLVGGGPGGAEAGTPRAPEGLIAIDEAVVGAKAEAVEPGSLSGGGSLGDLGVLPAVGPDVIKTADLGVLVPDGRFDTIFAQAVAIAGKHGGYVQSSSTAGRESRSGTLLIRVPARSFEQAVEDLTALGDPTRKSISGQDVSSTFIDLEARLRTWQAQEAVLLRLMRRAKSIEETLRVQRELQDVQFRIEQIKGQLLMLRDQVDLATISVSIRERGAPVPQGPKADRPSLAEAWQLAVNGVLGIAFAVVVGLGYLVPLAGLVGIAWLAIRRFRPRPAPAA